MMHYFFLRKALSLAKRGQGKCAPNPSVGALAVHNGKIIASAWHHKAGMPHAERLVIDRLPKGLKNVTLYLTLEPCNHWGKTPPCVDAIIEYGGINSVYFAYVDPNPIVMEKNTPATLRSHGIEVHMLSFPDIDAFYEPYVYWITTGMPWVISKIAQSLDAKIAGKNGAPQQISNEQCHRLTHQMRRSADIILTSSKTIQCDNPRLNVRLGKKPEIKPVAILDRTLSLNENYYLFNGTTPLIIFHDKTIKPVKSLAYVTYVPVTVSNNKLNLSEVLRKLGDFGYHQVFVEAGAVLFEEIHKNRLVNRTYLYVAPKWLGADGIDAYRNGLDLSQKHRLSVTLKGDNLLVDIQWEQSCLQE